MELPLGNLITPVRTCVCCETKEIIDGVKCNDCGFFCHAYCEFNSKSKYFKSQVRNAGTIDVHQ